MPNKIRGETLGSFLKSAVDPSNTEFVNEADAAAEAFNPGFTAETDLGTAQPSLSRALLLNPAGTGVQDLSIKHLKAFSEYARSLTSKHNIFYPNVDTFAGGTLSKDTIVTANDSTSFLGAPHPTRPDEKSYFDTITMGGSAGTREGGFFNDNIPTFQNFDKDTLKAFLREKYLLKDVIGDAGKVSLLGDAVEYVIHDTNMYSPRADGSPYTKYVPGGATVAGDIDEFFNKEGLWSIQTGDATSLGKFDKDAPRLTVAEIRGMALKMLMKASGENIAANLIGLEAEGLNAAILKAYEESMTNLTNGVQVGIRPVRMSELNLRAQINEATTSASLEKLRASTGNLDFTDGIEKSDLTGNHGVDNTRTIGSLNNPGEYFGGPLPIGMLMTVLVGLLSFVLISVMIEVFLAGPEQDDITSQKPGPETPWRLAAGGARARSAGSNIMNMFMKLFGLPKIQSDSNFVTAFFRGIQRFYGIGIDFKNATTTPLPILLVEILESMINIAMAPGFYAVMQRVIMRDVNKIGDAFQPVGVPGGGNPAIAAMEIFKAVEVLATSTTFRFVIVCIGLGDKGYDALYSPGRVHTGEPAGVPNYKDEANQQLLTPYTRMYLSRFHGNSGKDVYSPMSLESYDSLLLSGREVPTATRAKFTHPKDAKKAVLEPHSSIASFITTGDSRLASDIVSAYESVLNQEYVPFYFHDLRTNEIIAMPAFITSVNESFAPSYAETQAYGRTDPIYGYTSTKRTIDLSFKLVAMNPEDHEYMWFVIEKLVAMCYPQRSIGKIRHIQGGTAKFVQPFSQIPTASPVIRIRLGELLHSNFKMRRLMSLFGYPGVMNLKIDDPASKEAFNKKLKELVPKANAVKVLKARALNELKKGEAKPSKIIYRALEKSEFVQTTKIPGVIPFLTAEAFKVVNFTHRWPFNILGTKTVAPSKDQPSSTGEEPKDKTPPRLYYEAELLLDKQFKTGASLNRAIFKQFPGTKNKSLRNELIKAKKIGVLLPVDGLKGTHITTKGIVDLNLYAQPEEWDDAVDTVWKELLGAAAAPVTDNPQDIPTFFNSDSNAIVKSFESSAGQGLAGVITNMSLNYDSAVWGTNPDKNDRVPRSVEISLSFAPIHDLPLGLGHDGRIIAPAHQGHDETLQEQLDGQASEAADIASLNSGEEDD